MSRERDEGWRGVSIQTYEIDMNGRYYASMFIREASTVRLKTSLAISLTILVISLLAAAYFARGYYKHLYLLKLHFPEDGMPGMPYGYMASAPMWTHGLWISAFVVAVFAVMVATLAAKRNR